MKINCLSCGHKVDLDDAYDDFEGQVKCYTCNTLLEIKTEEGKVRSVRLMRFGARLEPGGIPATLSRTGSTI